jgi:hypothetical protein
MNGKGSMGRPRSVSGDEYRDNFDRIFAGDKDTRTWGYAHSKDAEHWHSDGETTREEILVSARAYFDEGEPFAICRCEIIDPVDTLPRADEIVERMSEIAGDTFAWIDEYPDVSQAACEELDKLLRAWAKKHVTCGSWVAVDIEEIEGGGK